MTEITGETCMHCGRRIVLDPTEGWIDPRDGWVDPRADGDDVMWRTTCDSHDTFTAEHEPAPTKLRVTWHHPAVMYGSSRVVDIEVDPSTTDLKEAIARAFCPYGVEGAAGVVITNTRRIA